MSGNPFARTDGCEDEMRCRYGWSTVSTQNKTQHRILLAGPIPVPSVCLIRTLLLDRPAADGPALPFPGVLRATPRRPS